MIEVTVSLNDNAGPIPLRCNASDLSTIVHCMSKAALLRVEYPKTGGTALLEKGATYGETMSALMGLLG